MKADRILTNLNQIFCPEDKGRPLRGEEMSKATIIEHGFIAIKDGKILKIGKGTPDSSLIGDQTELVDCTGKIASPGLIDSHTHLVYGGTRENEFAKKLNGVPYLEILEQGGGILSSVRSTREASFDELYNKTEKLLSHMMVHGVTTVEAKSGYGLDWATEEKQLKVAHALNERMPVDVISTFMAAHAVPPEYKGRGDEYVELIIEEMLPKVEKEQLAEFCDVFCESGVFTAAQSKKVLEAARKHGLKLRIHADEIKSIGGVDVAAELQTTSAEHLMVITDEGIQKLRDSHVMANLLPATTFSLMEDTYAPAKKMIEQGVAVTLSTDSNPGSCPTANMQFIMQLGCFSYKMTPIQVFNAVTINAAYCVDRGATVGSFDEGKEADITLFDAPNIDYPLYFFATNLVSEVYKKGKLVVKDRQLVK